MEKKEEIKAKNIVDQYYPALMLFLVFTFANNLLQGFIRSFSIELLLYIIMWAFLTIQTTFAFKRIKEVEPKNYPVWALLSDCLDILIAIYVCAAIGGVSGWDGKHELSSFLHLSIPFLILSVNQFTWFILVKNFDVPALFRISILFCGMLAVTISESVSHCFGNLVAVVSLIVVLGILRVINKAPKPFQDMATSIWTFVKRKLNYPQHA